jgi:Cytochrome c7 and related cytochrome c
MKTNLSHRDTETQRRQRGRTRASCRHFNMHSSVTRCLCGLILRFSKKPQSVRWVTCLVISLPLLLIPNLIYTDVVHSGANGPHRQAQNRRSKKATKPAAQKNPRVDYSRFSHVTHVTTQKLSCASCHKFPTKNWKEARKGDAAFPDVAEFPEHSSCLNCHRPQFFARERPAPSICSNCHVSLTPRDTTRFLFPSLGDVSEASKQRRDLVTEFAINFPHDKHIEVVGLNPPALKTRGGAGFMTVTWQQKPAPENPSEPKSCPVCHQTYQPQGASSEEYVTKPPKNMGDAFWLKKGTFKTIPNSHTVCFTCHNPDAGIAPAPGECNVCHKLAPPQPGLKTDFDPKLPETIGVTDKTILSAWRRRISAGAFRHEGGEHPNVSCMNCHNVPTMKTVDMKTLAVPLRSCGGAEGCHITATTDDGGSLNYEIDQKKKNPGFVCAKCHISFGKEGVPADHLAVIPIAPKK